MTDAGNEQQRDYWNGKDSREWVVEADRFDAMLAPFADLLLDAAAPTSTDRVLDVGCGNGATTLAAARRAAQGEAVGFDISEPMLGVARERAAAEGLSHARFVLGDAQTDALDGPYDSVISRFGIMFFADPVAAFTNLRDALAPGGRATFVCWQSVPANPWVMVPTAAILEHVPPPEMLAPDTPGPFRFCESGSLDAVLGAAGFVDVRSTGHRQPMLLGGPSTYEDAVEFVVGGGMTRRALGDAPEDVRARALDAMRDALVPYRVDEGIRLDAAVWLVEASR